VQVQENPTVFTTQISSHIQSGIPGLDDLMEGGFIPNSSILLRGESGSGKTIFGLHFLKHGALNGEPGVFLSMEEERQDINRESRRFGWDLEALEKKGTLLIVEEKAQYNLTINELYNSIKRIKAKRVVIDSIPALFSNYPNELRPSEWRLSFRSLCRNLNEHLGCTTIMITEADWTKGEAFEEYVTRGVIELQVKMMEGVMRRFLLIKKMREVRHSRRLQLYEITNNGFSLFTSQRRNE